MKTITCAQLKKICLDLPGVEHEYKPAWEADVFTVGGKMFAFIGEDKSQQAIINLKNEPLVNLELRQSQADWVAPGYYSNHDHWNSWYWQSEAADLVFLTEQIKISYRLVAGKLSKAVREKLSLGF